MRDIYLEKRLREIKQFKKEQIIEDIWAFITLITGFITIMLLMICF